MKQKGFTLIELLIAVSLLSISILAIFRLQISNNAFVNLHNNTLIAHTLADEGKEIVKGVLHAKGIPYFQNEYITDTHGHISIIKDENMSYKLIKKDDSQELVSINQKGDEATSDDLLQFTRKISITDNPVLQDTLLLTVEVSWSDQGGKHVRQLEEILF